MDINSFSTLGTTVEDFTLPPLKCNTTKDSVKLNYNTAGIQIQLYYSAVSFMNRIIVAGILAGVWPCRTVTMLGELFTAESMTPSLCISPHIHT